MKEKKEEMMRNEGFNDLAFENGIAETYSLFNNTYAEGTIDEATEKTEGSYTREK